MRAPLLLPVAALAVVAALVGSVMLAQAFFRTGHQAVAGSAGTAPPFEDPTRAAAPQFRPGATVCQGILHRPDPRQPRTFPSIYTKQEDVDGLMVVASAAVGDQAFAAARDTIERMFAHNDLLPGLVQQGAYVVIAAAGQGVLDLPEFGCLASQFDPGFFDHVCGVADRADYPVATVNELDLLGDSSGPCSGLNILYHEIGHLVQNWSLGPADYVDVKLDYQAALDAGKYASLYAATNPNEYFAEATQAYFLSQEMGGVRGRQWLSQYDPAVYALLQRVYGP